MSLNVLGSDIVQFITH